MARDEDDNRRRHVGVFALYDWCFGGDDQWLYETPADEATHSHDHGLYLFGDTWPTLDLVALSNDVHELAGDRTNLDPTTKVEIAARLETLTLNAVETVLRDVPPSWPVTDANLGDLASLLVARAPLVASRLRVL